MPFKKGHSGNPGGRPKVLAEVRDLARQHTPEAIDTLVQIMRDTDQDARARVAACNSLLDRGHGRPAQSISLQPALPCEELILIHSSTQPSPVPSPANRLADATN